MAWDTRLGGGTGSKNASTVEDDILDYVDAHIGALIYNVADYGAVDGAADSTTGVQAAYTAAAAAGGGVVWFPEGQWTFNAVEFGSNVHTLGCGWGSILRQLSGVADNTRLLAGFGTGTGVSTNVSNVSIRNVQLRGRIDLDAATQYVHLVSLAGVSDCLIEGVLFKGFRGDGIILASNNTAGTQVERHNERITIRKCRFDGINNLNRNGITITDGTDVLIHDNSFANCTATNRPGAIDIEPNTNAYHRVRDVHIDKNVFDSTCGGNAGVIGLFLNQAQTAYTLPVRGVKITRNTLRGCGNSSGGIFLNQVQTTIASTERQNVEVWGNEIIDLSAGVPLEAWGMRGLKIERNWFHNSAQAAIALGYASRCMDVEIIDNEFSLAGTTEGAVIDVYNADRVRIDGNTFDDQGTAAIGKLVNFGDGTGGTATSSNVEVLNSKLIGSNPVASAKTAGHTLSASTNLWVNNQMVPVAAHFGLPLDIYVEQTSDVTISATTAGTATTVVTATAFTASGTDSYWIDFQCSMAQPAQSAAASIIFVLYEASAQVGGQWAVVAAYSATAVGGAPVRVSRKLTPSSGTRTYSVRAYRTVGDGIVRAASATYMPASIRVRKAIA